MRFNHYFAAQGSEKLAMEMYKDLPTSKADRCGSCEGYCVDACPFDVPIQPLLALAHERLTLA
jgi:ferredoxin